MSNAYDRLEAEVAEYLDGKLAGNLDPVHYAHEIMAERTLDRHYLNIEISGSDSITGNSIPASFDSRGATTTWNC